MSVTVKILAIRCGGPVLASNRYDLGKSAVRHYGMAYSVTPAHRSQLPNRQVEPMTSGHAELSTAR